MRLERAVKRVVVPPRPVANSVAAGLIERIVDQVLDAPNQCEFNDSSVICCNYVHQKRKTKIVGYGFEILGSRGANLGLWKKLVRNPSSMENIHNHYGTDSFQCLGT